MSMSKKTATEWMADNDPRGLALCIEIVNSGLLKVQWDAAQDDPVKQRAVIDRALALIAAAQAVDAALAGFDSEEQSLIAALVRWRNGELESVH